MNSKIFIAYVNRLFADGIEALIKGFENFEVVNLYPLGDTINNQKGFLNGIDILIIESNYPKRFELDLIYSLLDTYKSIKILLFSNQPGLKYGLELLDCGISGYLLKSCSANDLSVALNKIADNKSYFCSDITMELISASNKTENENKDILTKREVEILSQMMNCQCSKTIADQLQISVNTVRTHKRNIQTKLGVTSILEIFMYAMKNNLVDITSEEFCSDCLYFRKN